MQPIMEDESLTTGQMMSNPSHAIKNNFTHAVMFHHFYNEHHPQVQGALSGQQFHAMLNWLSERYNLLNADVYLYKFTHNALNEKDICLTLDDALLCQAEIAAPILKERNIQAFFFIYSSPFSGSPDLLEVFRYFRTTQFDSVEAFYENFFDAVRVTYPAFFFAAESKFDVKSYLKNYPFYTDNDRWFRYLRDVALGKEKYEEMMWLMMRKKEFEYQSTLKKLWMNETHLKTLKQDGHQIGLHSYSHPTTMHLLSKEVQIDEYKKNYAHLREVLSAAPVSMSHPCGSYNTDTLQILNSQGITIGFRSDLGNGKIQSNLEIPRQDHANILSDMLK